MIYFAHRLFNEEVAQDFRKRLLMSREWIDGVSSAKGSQLKRNLQFNRGEIHAQFSEEIIEIIKNDDLINNFSFPSKIFNILFTRTGEGMFYGPHFDSPYIESGRRDMSFTIFLNQPEDYKGGELILYIPPEKKQIKMKPGEMIIYPTKYLHEVKEVTEGERMVCVGWIESQISKDDDREMLSMLKESINQVIKNPGDSSYNLNLFTAYNNIYRRLIS